MKNFIVLETKLFTVTLWQKYKLVGITLPDFDSMRPQNYSLFYSMELKRLNTV